MNQQKITLNHLAALLVLLTVFFPAQAHALIALSEQNLLNRAEAGSVNAESISFSLPDAAPQLERKRRGAPKGNKNAQGNRGNRTIGDVRSKAREGKARGGAPKGNTNALKVRESLFDELATQYKGNSEVEQWLAQMQHDQAAMQLLSEPGEPGWRGEQLEDFMVDLGAQQRWMAQLRQF